MATITTISANDKISDSRAVINTNFANLNSDKIDVDGSVALTADWDAGEHKITVKELLTDTISEETTNAGVTIDGVKLKDSQVNTDQINEKTANAGVTIDGVKLKDSQPYCDVINEKTAGSGVTVDGVLLKDSQVSTDQINEKTANAGVTVDSVLLKDGQVEVSGHIQGTTGNGFLELRGDSGATNDVKLYDTGILDIEGQSRARAYRATSVQAINDSTWTKVQLNAESYDTQGEFDSATNYRFTATKAGYYVVSGAVELSSVGQVTKVVIAFYRNGSSVSQASFGENLGSGGGATHSDIIYLAANDYLELYVYQNSGFSLNAQIGENITFMSVHKIS